MSKREKIIAIVMSVFIAITMIMYLPKGKSRSKSSRGGNQSKVSSNAPTAPSNDANAVTEVNFDWRALDEKLKFSLQDKEPSLGNDPFEKLEPKLTELSYSDLILSGIEYLDGVNAVAVINGQVLQKGDSLSGFVVTDIQPNQVHLSKGDQKYILNFETGAEGR